MSRSEPLPPSYLTSDADPPAATGTVETTAKQKDAALRAERELAFWQRMLLPAMLWMVIGLTVVFLGATFYQLHTLQERIQAAPALELAPVLARLDAPATAEERILFPQWQTLALLEQQALGRRYHQANVLLLARTWTSYVGYLTGMILAMVGAVFILGKLREEASSLRLNTARLSANLRTTSPGLALCFLGSVLIMGTIMTHNEIALEESGPLYLTTMFVQQDATDTGPAPLPGDSADVFSELEVRNPVPDP